MPRQSRGKPTPRQEYDAAESRARTNGDLRAYDAPAEPDPEPKTRRRKAASEPGPATAPAQRAHGRIAASLHSTELRWFVEGWFAASMLNVIIGRKNVGKSSCLAWLLAKAQRPVILPGFEESVELMMLPRWRAANVLLRSLLVLNTQHYSPQLQTSLLVSILREHRADLLVIENLDSYLPPDASTNDSQAVRPYLESLHSIAVQSGIPVVGTRHPGKDPANLCPGSHCWEDVPRISVVLEREEGRSPTYWMWSHRCGVGRQPDPVTYSLASQGPAPPVFTLADEPDMAALRWRRRHQMLLDRQRLRGAVELLTALLAEDWVEAKVVFTEAEKERLGEGTLRCAAKILGVQMRREGSGLNHKSFWGRAGLDRPWVDADQP